MITIEDMHIYHTSVLLKLGRSRVPLLTIMLANASISFPGFLFYVSFSLNLSE